jgi:hypothetical protein
MQKCKKNILRILVALAFFSTEHGRSESPSGSITLKIGGVRELNIDSPEGIKVKGSSVHLYQTSASTYKAIGIKAGLSIVDPTPVSRTDQPILIRVEAEEKEEELNCKNIGLYCERNQISGMVQTVQQIYFLNGNVDRKWSDLTSGQISFKGQEPTILGIPIHSIEKHPGRILMIHGNLTLENQNTISKVLSNLKVVFPRKNVLSKYVKVVFQFTSEGSANLKDFSKIIADPTKIAPSTGKEASQDQESTSEKVIRVENAQKFSFTESFKTKNGELSAIEGQGNFLWDSKIGIGSFRVKSKSEVGESVTDTSFQTEFNTLTLLSDSILNGNKNAGATLSPWGHIPILSILFKVFTERSFDTRSKVWVELLTELSEHN